MDVQKIRADFPILQKKVKGKPFIYFDNSCVTLKPKQVIDAEMAYYTDYTACHGRSVHYFAQRTTEEFKKAHSSVAKLVGANENEIVITKNTTEAINTVSNGLDWKPGDRVLTTKMEHNSNLIPWMKLARDRGVEHDYVEVDAEGQLDLEDLKRQLGRKTKLVSIVYTSNVTGATIDAREVAKIAHDYGALILLDAAQTVPHRKVDVKRDNIDFLAFSGHKMLGPSGTGALYGKYDLLQGMSQFIVGGETVKSTSLHSWEPEDPPMKFEAGLQNYAGASGFGTAAEYLMKIGMGEIEKYEKRLARLLYEGLVGIRQINRIYGPRDPAKRAALAAFSVTGMNPHDVALLLNESANIFVRSGMHCTHLYHNEVIGEKQGTVRPSLYIYNTEEELAAFFDALKKVVALA